ncbi:MAG: aminotransferase class I/II-fold pyridoxal phosphate-dependent enzyme [Bacteroidales bacterium]|jgi:aspartate/methionine/tyrosine aminotransferase
MYLKGETKAALSNEARQLLNLYKSLGERAEIFLPRHIYDNLTSFVKLCFEEPDDPAVQQAEINRYLLKFREDIPGYTDISLMITPHEDSKAFELSARRRKFIYKLNCFLDKETVPPANKSLLRNIRDSHDFSVGTPPVRSSRIDFISRVQLGGQASELRKFRDLIGVTGDVNEGHWNFLMDTLEQMICQSTHYTTGAEVDDFLNRTRWTVNFKGLNGMIRTVVSGNADKAVELIRSEVFGAHSVRVLENPEAKELFAQMEADSTSVFVVKVPHMRVNLYSGERWFTLLTRLVIVDDSRESRNSNTSLVFCFHNGIINTLNKVHTKKLGAPANVQLNLRLILENVNPLYLTEFRQKIEQQIDVYRSEVDKILETQVGSTTDEIKRLNLFKLDMFTRKIVQDKHSLEKLRDFIWFLENSNLDQNRQGQTHNLIAEFERRIREYFYSDNASIEIVSVLEGGGRNQISSYGEYLLQKPFKKPSEKISKACRLILGIIPNNYERTLKNHFHKNFGVNLFFEKYQQYLVKTDNEANNHGRFDNFLIDLGIKEKYEMLAPAEQEVVRNFISALGNLGHTSVSDSAQMIVRDMLFNPAGRPKPYVIYNTLQAWEYKDLLPDDLFDINPFDIGMENQADGHLAYERLTERLLRLKATLSVFDDSGTLWDLFCENTTILINDPNNPTGYTDFNTEAVNSFLRLMNTCKITLFLDEAYADSVKVTDSRMPKWRTLSRYIINNINSQPNIRAVSSLSTTKNLSATGDRLGALAVTPQALSIAEFVRRHNQETHGNNCSLLMINNLVEVAQTAKRIKDTLESELPKNASRHKIRDTLVKFITEQVKRSVGFEGSPLYRFLLDELISLDKLDVLSLPDDFKYRNEYFFTYYQRRLVENLDRFRINKVFRSESLQRMAWAREAADKVLEKYPDSEISYLHSDGSYLFNFRVPERYSYADLLDFCRALAENRGIAAVPYATGIVRFSLGGYIIDSPESIETFKSELVDGFSIFLHYWTTFASLYDNPSNKNVESHTLLQRIFSYNKDKELMNSVISDYEFSACHSKTKAPSLLIRDIRTLYHASPEKSGVSITTIDRSRNSVIELHGDKIGSCRDVSEFVSSAAFTKVYENLLAQVYRRVPATACLDFNAVSSKYSKAVILKYITNKRTFQPNHHVLDDPDELNTMREILIEMERLLFSDSKTKILAMNATGNAEQDKSKQEGINSILKKYICDILLHFNLPFEHKGCEPSRAEIVCAAGKTFEEVTGIKLTDLNLNIWIDEFVRGLRELPEFCDNPLSERSIGFILDSLADGFGGEERSITDKVLYLFLLHNDDSFYELVTNRLKFFRERIESCPDHDLRIFREEFISEILPSQLNEINRYILRKKDIKVAEQEIHAVSRKVVLFYISMIKRTKGTDYYKRYIHTMIRLVEVAFEKQNSSVNQFIQHGISLYSGFTMKNRSLETFDNGRLEWINRLMSRCGVIASEQPVQVHTRIATDAKKREYPFHKIDRISESPKEHNGEDYLKSIDLRPDSEFFVQRLARFIENMDTDDYRCKVVKHGLVKELVVFQKGYLKYLTDNYRLNHTEDIRLEDIRNFVPDVISFLGAPEKLISFPEIGYFDIPGPDGNIKTIITPLKQKVDYFGDVKKPRLTVINEKIKEMGGNPRHGSLFAVEENDGALFVVEINGDSGVGKSEMIAAFVLKWLRNNLEGVRSVKLIAGDMFHEFQDSEGSLYGIGTEVGDFSRTTDFDPDYIKYYKYLFERSADSNVSDLNSRSTISGMCDISMPYKVDIMLSAANYSRSEAGIVRVDNPENFLLYIDSHGERKEKATSEDSPNFQCTLRRYTADKQIVTLMAEHGNYLDDILDWEYDNDTKTHYLASSYKMLDKIDIANVSNRIFTGKTYRRDGLQYTISGVSFDMIRNRFVASTVCENGLTKNLDIDRKLFGTLFDSLASTPGGQPFIAEEGQIDSVMNLVKVLRGGANGEGKARSIRYGILSTEIGKHGREITGPQKAALELKRMIQEVRVSRPEINEGKMEVKRLLNEKYAHIFNGRMYSAELWRYNFYLYQLELMRKADYRRMDDISRRVDMRNLVDFVPIDPHKEFCPLLVNPNLNIELNSFSETFEELMSLPNYCEFANEFELKAGKLYIADGYSTETVVNNMIVQLLMMEGYITTEDVARGSVIEKVNRETIAAAKYAVVRYMETQKAPSPGKQQKKRSINSFEVSHMPSKTI